MAWSENNCCRPLELMVWILWLVVHVWCNGTQCFRFTGSKSDVHYVEQTLTEHPPFSPYSTHMDIKLLCVSPHRVNDPIQRCWNSPIYIYSFFFIIAGKEVDTVECRSHVTYLCTRSDDRQEIKALMWLFSSLCYSCFVSRLLAECAKDNYILKGLCNRSRSFDKAKSFVVAA